MVLNALKSFPNLEMLPLTYSLSDQGPNLPRESLAVRDLMNTVHLPRLRHCLELKELFAYVSPTTSLTLSPSYVGDPPGICITVPLFRGYDLFPSGPAAHRAQPHFVFSILGAERRDVPSAGRRTATASPHARRARRRRVQYSHHLPFHPRAPSRRRGRPRMASGVYRYWTGGPVSRWADFKRQRRSS